MAEVKAGDIEQGQVQLDRPRSTSRPQGTFALRLTTLFKFQKPRKRHIPREEQERVMGGLLTKDQFFIIKALFGSVSSSRDINSVDCLQLCSRLDRFHAASPWKRSRSSWPRYCLYSCLRSKYRPVLPRLIYPGLITRCLRVLGHGQVSCRP